MATLQSDTTMQSILTDEVQTFLTHPAILTWYIADDPNNTGVSVSKLESAYALVKQLDPYRPVMIVAMPSAPLSSYLNAFDILMVNPYPIPDNPVTYTADTVDSARLLVGGGLTKPVWTSLQAFGGSDGYLREPTLGEMRTQAYLAIAHGSRGVQYCKRREPIGMPKSTLAWNACRRAAMEASMLVPTILSGETSPSITLTPSSIQGRAFLDKGLLTVIAVNTINQPAQSNMQIVGNNFTGQADVPFEYRQVQVTNGTIAESIEPHGIRVYQMAVGPIPSDQVSINPANLTPNPSWETMPNPATPDGCYFGFPQDLAATVLLDPTTYLNGRRSLRFITPTAGQGVLISPTPVTTQAGSVYRFSVWAKTNQEGTSLWMQAVSGTTTQTQIFVLTKNWQEYAITITAATTMSSNISYTGPGKAWIDVMQIVKQ
jgi:hypothetical protein